MSKRIFLLTMLLLILSTFLVAQAQDEDPTSSTIIFFSTFDDGIYTIRSLDYDTNQMLVWFESITGSFTANVSKTHLLTSSLREGFVDDGQYDIVLVTQDASQEITNSGDNFGAVWSPISDADFAYISHVDEEYTIVLNQLDDLSSPTVIFTDSIRISNLSWSTDGDFLSFIGCTEDFSCQLNILNFATRQVRQIELEGTLNPLDVIWQPFSDNVTVLAVNSLSFTEQYVYQMDIATGVATQIAFPQAQEYWSLTWDTLGENLAFTSNKDGDWDIYVLDVITNDITQITTNTNLQDGIYGIDWSEDNSSLVYSSGPFEGYCGST